MFGGLQLARGLPTSPCRTYNAPELFYNTKHIPHGNTCIDSAIIITAKSLKHFKQSGCHIVSCCLSRQRADTGHDTVKLLQSRNRYPKKWLGQHYMVDERVNEELINSAEVQPGDVVLEIGPGTGSLTNVLLRAGAQVIAIEKDPVMASLVLERFNNETVEVVHEDFLKWHVHEGVSRTLKLANDLSKHKRLAKVVSNIPFNITTDVLKKLLPMGDLFSVMVLLIQDDAAVRFISSSPESDDYRAINLFIKFYSVPEYKMKVERTNFFPQPKVDAAVVRFAIKEPSKYPNVHSKREFFSMVNSAFTNRRKMLRKSLQPTFSSSEVQSALSQVGLPETARPTELKLDKFVDLHNALGLCQRKKMAG